MKRTKYDLIYWLDIVLNELKTSSEVNTYFDVIDSLIYNHDINEYQLKLVEPYVNKLCIDFACKRKGLAD